MEAMTDDRMSVAELYARCKKLRDACGAAAFVDISVVCSKDRPNPVSVAVYEDGICGHIKGRHFFAKDFTAAFAAAEAHVAGRALIRPAELIRKMALAIIEITDEHTKCTEALLRAKGFSAADIASTKDAACVRASEMCANAPFVVLP